MADYDVTTKTCSKCLETKPLDAFPKDPRYKLGRKNPCLKCCAEAARERRQRDPEKAKEIYSRAAKAAYARDPEKFKRRSRENRKRNPEKHLEAQRRWREEKRDLVAQYMREYYERNKEEIKARVREREQKLRVELRPYNAERTMRRNARKLQATPSWACQEKIAAIYAESATLTTETGVPHNVDHIVPLQGKTVCGLHVEHNLQVTTRPDNQSKGNRYWPDDWRDFS